MLAACEGDKGDETSEPEITVPSLAEPEKGSEGPAGSEKPAEPSESGSVQASAEPESSSPAVQTPDVSETEPAPADSSLVLTEPTGGHLETDPPEEPGGLETVEDITVTVEGEIIFGGGD